MSEVIHRPLVMPLDMSRCHNQADHQHDLNAILIIIYLVSLAHQIVHEQLSSNPIQLGPGSQPKRASELRYEFHKTRADVSILHDTYGLPSPMQASDSSAPIICFTRDFISRPQLRQPHSNPRQPARCLGSFCINKSIASPRKAPSLEEATERWNERPTLDLPLRIAIRKHPLHPEGDIPTTQKPHHQSLSITQPRTSNIQNHSRSEKNQHQKGTHTK